MTARVLARAFLLAAVAQIVASNTHTGDSLAFVRKLLETEPADFVEDRQKVTPTNRTVARSLLQYGASNVPFTMSQVTSFDTNAPSTALNVPSKLWPWSSTGIIEHETGPLAGTKCPAALIGPNLAVTSASCFCSYGGTNQFSSAQFKSGYFDGGDYFEAEVSNTFPSTYYCSGTDTCTTDGALRKCANNIAVVSLLNINKPQGLVGLAPGNVSPYYTLGNCTYSFSNGLTGQPAAQITALGYASNLNSGSRMMRTDSLGQLQSPNQLYIGSTMRANSSGSPMLVNFGKPMSNSLPLGSEADPNVMVGVVSWYSAEASGGANDYIVGGSCFGKNSQYTQYSNIVTLVNTYCCTLNLEQRAAQCDGVQTCLDDPVPPPPPPPPPVTASDWVQSAGGASCTATCTAEGKTCNQAGQRAVTTLTEAINVAKFYLGVVDPETLPTYSGTYDDGPTIWAGSLQYDGSGSTCDGSYADSYRFCCCGTDCPTVNPNAPSPPPPSPTPPAPAPPSGTPGAPTNVAQSGNSANAITITWTDGTIGSPIESYAVECKVYQGSFSSASEVSVTGISRGAQRATVPINPSTLYTCYVAAYDPAASPAYNPQVCVAVHGGDSVHDGDSVQLNSRASLDIDCVIDLLAEPFALPVLFSPLISHEYSLTTLTINVCRQPSPGLVASYQNSGTCTGRDLLDPSSFGAPRRCDTAEATKEQQEQLIANQIAVFGKPASEVTSDDLASNAFGATVPICWYICQNTLTVTNAMLANQIQVLNTDYAAAGIQFSQQSKLLCQNDRGGQGYTNWQANLGANSNIDQGFNYLVGLSQTLGHSNCITVYMGDWDGTGLLGIAQLGLSTYPTQFNYPGTLPGGDLSPYNLGRTMTHETGHNLGLNHVFAQGCSGLGDSVADTPLGTTNYGCPVGQNSCPSGAGGDAINNFMDYTNDCCMNFFTPQQGAVMQAEIQQRKSGWVTSTK